MIKKVLLSTPKLKDFYFSKSIIIIIEENQNHCFGLILNKTMNEKISDIWETVDPKAKINKNKNLRNGGPVYGSVHVIHKIKKYSEDELFNKTYISVHPKNIKKILESKRPYEMYVGYCSWTIAQLKAEIYSGWWWESDPEDLMIFGDNYDYWKLKKEEQGKKMLNILNIRIQNHFIN